MTSKKEMLKGEIWKVVAVLFLGFIALIIYGISKYEKRNAKLVEEDNEQRLASISRYVESITEKHIGDPPEFLYQVEYRVLRLPYPTSTDMERNLGQPDATKDFSGTTQLEWDNPTNKTRPILRADFGKDGQLDKIYYGSETIGRTSIYWKREMEIPVPNR